MKKVIMSLIAVTVMATVLNAQTDKGDWMVGGNLVISTPTGNSQFTVQPMAGYFFAKGFVAGVNLNLDFEKQGSQKASEISVGPYARYYFNLKSPSFKPFLHAEYNLGNRNVTVSTVKTSNTTGKFFLGAGGAFFINSNVALEGVAGYAHTKIQGTPVENGFLFRIGFQVHLLGGEVNRVTGQ